MHSLFYYMKRMYFERKFGFRYIARTFNVTEAREIGVKVGNDCRIYSVDFSSEPYLIEIGNHVTITDGVSFVPHDGAVWIFRGKEPEIELFGKITIGNNVFVGLNATILFNTIIGDNSVIAAGALVKGVFEPNSVIAGVPGRRICSVEEYYKKNKHKYSFFRSLTGERKRMAVLEKVNNSTSEPNL